MWNRHALVLATRGRKSGLERTVPLQFFPYGDRVTVVAANSGLPSPPDWYFNLTADPRARLDVAGRTLEVHLKPLLQGQGKSRSSGWSRRRETFGSAFFSPVPLRWIGR